MTHPLDETDPKAMMILADLYLVDFHVGGGFEVADRDDFEVVPESPRTYRTTAATYVVGDDTVMRKRAIDDERAEVVVYARGEELSREVVAN